MNKYNKLIYSSFFASVLLSGCYFKQPSNEEVINNMVFFKNSVLNGEKELKKLNLKEETTLAGCYGPSIILTEENFDLLKFSNKTMLFSGYGIKDKIYLLTASNMSFKEKDIRSRELGFKDLNHMFNYLFNFYKTKDISEISLQLDFLKENNLLSFNSLSNKSINKKNQEIINYTYFYYNQLESNVEEKNKYGIWINNKFIVFTKEDFKPYALLIQIMDQLLTNNTKGVMIYGN